MFFIYTLILHGLLGQHNTNQPTSVTFHYKLPIIENQMKFTIIKCIILPKGKLVDLDDGIIRNIIWQEIANKANQFEKKKNSISKKLIMPW